MQIGIVSDTHNHWDTRIEAFFSRCEVILHAGDIGSLALADRIAAFRPLIAVSGNIDDAATRREYPLTYEGYLGSCHVLMTHIGGHPGRYAPGVRKAIAEAGPNIFICGHSHILRVMYDRSLGTLYVNPGAYGLQGFHSVRTALRLRLEGATPHDLEVLEIPRGRGK